MKADAELSSRRPQEPSVTTLSSLSAYDLAAIAIYLAGWLAYHLDTERSNARRCGVNSLMAKARAEWMSRMARREVRIVDTQITASLQNGSAFFASTSMIALGATISMLRATDDMIRIFEDLPLGSAPSRAVWEVKVVGLAIVFGYAFFKFAWAYRLFNYTAILIGATPFAEDPDAVARDRAVKRATRMNVAAGAHFARGQRALFFAVAYLGWFVSPFALVAATLFVIVIMRRRQFASDAQEALLDEGT
jgi:uncharacterized membrane protein